MSILSDVISLPVHFEYYAIFESWILKQTAGTRQTDDKTWFGLEKLKKISQIIKDYFYFLFLLIIL